VSRRLTLLGGVTVAVLAAAVVPVALTRSSASAQGLSVDTMADAPDAVPGDGVCATAASACSLRAALDEAAVAVEPVTVTVPAGTYTLTLGALAVRGGTVVVQGSAGAVVTTADVGSRLVESFGADLTLADLTLSGVAGGPDGGALAATGGRLTLLRDTFTGNTGSNGGAVVVSQADVTIDGSTFEANNAAGEAGALLATYVRSLRVVGSTFRSNGSAGGGGAVVVEGQAGTGGVFSILGTTFADNVAGGPGGALLVRNLQAPGLLLDGITATGNVGSLGGALAVDEATVAVHGGTFAGNEATTGDGGAIANGGDLTVEGATFTGNRAARSGGAVGVSGPTRLVNVTFTDNTADGLGGAVLGTAAGLLDVEGGSESGNTSLDDTAIVGAKPKPLAQPVPAAPPVVGAPRLARLAGSDRIATAIAISQESFGAGAARAVVLARADEYPDALGAGPLAHRLGGPLLLTPGAKLDLRVLDELHRVLPAGGRVVLVGGASALAASLEADLRAAGFAPERVGGADRYETAALVAQQVLGMGDGQQLSLATGAGFADALCAAAGRGAVLLVDPGHTSAAGAVIASAPGVAVRAVGGPAARTARAAGLAATEIVGTDRYDTCARLADPASMAVVAASGLAFPDALAGAPFATGQGAALLLVPPRGALPASVRAFLGSSARAVTVLGGPAAVDDSVAASLMP
jgi:hypothetical protein